MDDGVHGIMVRGEHATNQHDNNPGHEREHVLIHHQVDDEHYVHEDLQQLKHKIVQ